MHKKMFLRNIEIATEIASKFYDEFGNESDRGLVVLGVSKLDKLGGEILSRSLRPGQENDDIVERNELRNFGSRIKICYLLGLFDKMYFDILNRMKAERNKFAHEVDSSLNTDRIKSIVNDLSGSALFPIAKDVLSKFTEAYPKDKSGRANFELILFFFVLMLDLRLRIGVKPIYKETKGLWMERVLASKS